MRSDRVRAATGMIVAGTPTTPFAVGDRGRQRDLGRRLRRRRGVVRGRRHRDDAAEDDEGQDEDDDDRVVAAGDRHGVVSRSREVWACVRRPAGPASPSRGHGHERDQREQDEQHQEHDRELPQAAFDAAAAAVDGRVAAEGARQARAACLQQDGGDEGDAQQDLADGQDRVHGWVDLRGVTVPDGSRSPGRDRLRAYASSERPVIPSQRGRPASSRIVGATSARTPSRRSRPRTDRPGDQQRHGVERVRRDGVARGVAQLVGVAVVGGDQQHGAGTCRVGRLDALDGVGDAAEAARRAPRARSTVAPTRRCGRPCPGSRSSRR